VVKQCEKGETVCAADTMEACAGLTNEHLGGDTAGFVPPGPQTCVEPKKAVHWCQIDEDPRCQELSMVHERAHACGWHHRDGKGVPGAAEGKVFGCKSLGQH